MSPFQIQTEVRRALGDHYPFNDVHVEYHFSPVEPVNTLTVWAFFGQSSDRIAVYAHTDLRCHAVTKKHLALIIAQLNQSMYRQFSNKTIDANHV